MNLKKIVGNPNLYALYAIGRFCRSPKANEAYLNALYRRKFGRSIDFRNPATYNEKLQWLKLYYRDPDYSTYVDKAEVKHYVSGRVGSKYVIPTIGLWNNVDDINFENLPNQFVLKCTHDSGGIVVCKDKSTLDVEKAKRILDRGLKRKYFINTREWPYAAVTPRILCEEYVSDADSEELKDYKFFCFDGEPKALFVATGRQAGDTRFNFYDMDFNLLPFRNGHENSDFPIEKPELFDEMVSIAAALSEGMPHVRVDLYGSSKGVLFGELTFFHWSGLTPFDPAEWDCKFGEWLNLPKRNWDGRL